jgi:heterotetrameric sarcosine oxidase gamma subunit
MNFQSPLAHKTPHTGSIGLQDLSGRPLYLVRDEDQLREAFGAIPQKIGEVVGTALPSAQVARLTTNQYLVSYTTPTGEPMLPNAEDLTHGRGHMLLYGAHAADVLAKVCGLDFDNFPNNTCAQTSLAKVKTLIVRLDEGQTQAYHLIVDRSLAAYVWDVVFDAIQEY